MSCCPKNKCGREFDPDCEAPSDADINRFGGDDIACPNCGTEVYHDAAVCHSCGHAIEHASASRTKLWVAMTAGAMTIVFVLVFAL